HVQTFDDLGAAFGNDLTALAGHQPGKVVGLALDELGEVVEQLGPADAASAPPCRVSRPRRGDGAARVLGTAGGQDANDFRGPGGVTALEGGTACGLPLTGDEVAADDVQGGIAHGPRLLRRDRRLYRRTDKSRPGVIA